MTVTLEKPIKRRGPISEEHRSALREAALKRHDVAPTPSVLPAVLLRLELVAARRAGRAFEEVWADALEAALAGTGGPRSAGRQDWTEALRQTRRRGNPRTRTPRVSGASACWSRRTSEQLLLFHPWASTLR